MATLVYDLLILAVLALFVWRGWRKGLILSLCGLIVVVLSFVGAGFIADTAAPPVARAIEPKLAATIEKNLNSYMTMHYDDFTPPDPIDHLREMGGIYAWAADPLEQAGDAVSSTVLSTVKGVAEYAANTIALQLAHHILFAVAFVVLFVALTILLHALDLVAKLPGLNFCNGLGGGLIGLVKGVLVLFVAVCVLQITSGKLFAPEAVEKTYLFKFFVTYNPILTLFRPTALT